MYSVTSNLIRRLVVCCLNPLLLAVCYLALSGCSYSYIDDDGLRHVVGVVNLKLKSADDSTTYAGHVVDLSKFGVSVNENAAGHNFTIGYNRQVTGYLRDNALVIGNPMEIRTVTDDRAEE